MRSVLALAAALPALAGAAAVLEAPVTERPPAGFTGGFGEPSCVACHIGSEVNAFGGRVTVEGLPDAYSPGASYPLTIVLEAEGTEVAGFQISARYARGAERGRNAGRLEPLDARVEVTDSAGVSYAHQSLVGSRPASTDRASWTLTWVAPASGAVALHLAANSGNADNSPLSDLVYTAEAIVPPAR